MFEFLVAKRVNYFDLAFKNIYKNKSQKFVIHRLINKNIPESCTNVAL